MSTAIDTVPTFLNTTNSWDKSLKLALPLLVIFGKCMDCSTFRLRRYVAIGRGVIAPAIALRLFKLSLFGEAVRPADREHPERLQKDADLQVSDVVMPLLVGLVAVHRTITTLASPEIGVISLGSFRRSFLRARFGLYIVTSLWGIYDSVLARRWIEQQRQIRGDEWADHRDARALAGRVQAVTETADNALNLMGVPYERVTLALQVVARSSGVVNCWWGAQG